MTQEELDALLNSHNDLENMEDIEENDGEELENEIDNNEDEEIYPPPAEDKHKVVAQLDEVTKESEEKASQVLEIITSISDDLEKYISSLKSILEFLEHQKTIFEKLHEKFPDIKTFEKELNSINEKINEINEILSESYEVENKVLMALEIMQYQDIHRQKIERVINIMRALIKYMNKLFEGRLPDEERVKSAHHIHGDENEDVVSDEDIEELLKQFGV